MNNCKGIIYLLFLIVSLHACKSSRTFDNGNKPPKLKFSTKFKFQFKLSLSNEELELGKSYFSPTLNDSFKIDVLRFYITNIGFDFAGAPFGEMEKEYHLIDFSNDSSTVVNIETPLHGDHLTFQLGVDSLINAGGAMDGVLDPVNGMYWSWQSGYVNFKMEGSSPMCQTRNNKFNLHLGGFLSPNQSACQVKIPFTHVAEEMNIDLPIEKIFENYKLSEVPDIMSPGSETVRLSKVIAESFAFKK